ncbi:phosphate-starvation-inducible PsiE family protein [Acidihalobacter ferrooxydans]|uniref:Phosphate-starvation-inducible E-like protein n=1 Tax=Acidihalobacter ferrooxydans TaxID=1765967 RepID=A0A1P8UID3_9GAMM|nr:phosphate-starvation-inducible PsiE family protein [Acidihalobacter ferrooxydans]APZ43599.1 hypothetical protein BW247_11290 [Acidihalobacter ferrooxydans]
MKLSVKHLFDRVTSAVFAVMLLFLTIGIIIGTGHLFLLLFGLFKSTNVAEEYLHMISQVLSLFVLIELSRSLVEYFNVHRLRLTFIVDAAIVFVLREVMIGLFETKIPVDKIYAFSALLFVLGLLRIGSVLVHQRGQTLDRGTHASTAE